MKGRPEGACGRRWRHRTLVAAPLRSRRQVQPHAAAPQVQEAPPADEAPEQEQPEIASWEYVLPQAPEEQDSWAVSTEPELATLVTPDKLAQDEATRDAAVEDHPERQPEASTSGRAAAQASAALHDASAAWGDTTQVQVPEGTFSAAQALRFHPRELADEDLWEDIDPSEFEAVDWRVGRRARSNLIRRKWFRLWHRSPSWQLHARKAVTSNLAEPRIVRAAEQGVFLGNAWTDDDLARLNPPDPIAMTLDSCAGKDLNKVRWLPHPDDARWCNERLPGSLPQLLREGTQRSAVHHTVTEPAASDDGREQVPGEDEAADDRDAGAAEPHGAERGGSLPLPKNARALVPCLSPQMTALQRERAKSKRQFADAHARATGGEGGKRLRSSTIVRLCREGSSGQPAEEAVSFATLEGDILRMPVRAAKDVLAEIDAARYHDPDLEALWPLDTDTTWSIADVEQERDTTASAQASPGHEVAGDGQQLQPTGKAAGIPKVWPVPADLPAAWRQQKPKYVQLHLKFLNAPELMTAEDRRRYVWAIPFECRKHLGMPTTEVIAALNRGEIDYVFMAHCRVQELNKVVYEVGSWGDLYVAADLVDTMAMLTKVNSHTFIMYFKACMAAMRPQRALEVWRRWALVRFCCFFPLCFGPAVLHR